MASLGLLVDVEQMSLQSVEVHTTICEYCLKKCNERNTFIVKCLGNAVIFVSCGLEYAFSLYRYGNEHLPSSMDCIEILCYHKDNIDIVLSMLGAFSWCFSKETILHGNYKWPVFQTAVFENMKSVCPRIQIPFPKNGCVKAIFFPFVSGMFPHCLVSTSQPTIKKINLPERSVCLRWLKCGQTDSQILPVSGMFYELVYFELAGREIQVSVCFCAVDYTDFSGWMLVWHRDDI